MGLAAVIVFCAFGIGLLVWLGWVCSDNKRALKYALSDVDYWERIARDQKEYSDKLNEHIKRGEDRIRTLDKCVYKLEKNLSDTMEERDKYKTQLEEIQKTIRETLPPELTVSSSWSPLNPDAAVAPVSVVTNLSNGAAALLPLSKKQVKTENHKQVSHEPYLS